MAIIGFSSSSQTSQHASCVICGENRPLDVMTTGLTGMDGNSAFACAAHLNKSQERAWFRGWLNFMVRLQVATAFAFVVRKLVVLA